MNMSAKAVREALENGENAAQVAIDAMDGKLGGPSRSLGDTVAHVAKVTCAAVAVGVGAGVTLFFVWRRMGG